MRLLSKAADGGKASGVTGYFLIEWKRLFSVVLLHFAPGSREAFHEHAFNAWTLWLTGAVEEHVLTSSGSPYVNLWRPGDLKRTPRDLMHKIIAGSDGAWALSVRGPWADRWREWRNGKYVTLTHGRREVV